MNTNQAIYLLAVVSVALFLLLGNVGCSTAKYKGGTPYSEALCESGPQSRLLGKPWDMPQEQWDYETVYICSGGLQ